jgi:hypothetical protein
MLTDRYGLELSRTSAAAQDAYVQASDLALTFYPGAAEAYDRAIAAGPSFALAHAGKAQVLMRQEYAMRLWQYCVEGSRLREAAQAALSKGAGLAAPVRPAGYGKVPLSRG